MSFTKCLIVVCYKEMPTVSVIAFAESFAELHGACPNYTWEKHVLLYWRMQVPGTVPPHIIADAEAAYLRAEQQLNRVGNARPATRRMPSHVPRPRPRPLNPKVLFEVESTYTGKDGCVKDGLDENGMPLPDDNPPGTLGNWPGF